MISTRDSLDKMYVDVTLPAWSCSTISSASDADADMVVCYAVQCLWGWWCASGWVVGEAGEMGWGRSNVPML